MASLSLTSLNTIIKRHSADSSSWHKSINESTLTQGNSQMLCMTGWQELQALTLCCMHPKTDAKILIMEIGLIKIKKAVSHVSRLREYINVLLLLLFLNQLCTLK